jgi:hypothetical protein
VIQGKKLNLKGTLFFQQKEFIKKRSSDDKTNKKRIYEDARFCGGIGDGDIITADFRRFWSNSVGKREEAEHHLYYDG